jgi:copper(I)-binding protein
MNLRTPLWAARRNLITLTGIGLALAGLTAQAHEYKLGDIAIAHPHALSTVGELGTAAVYMAFKNTGAADRLLSASTAASGSVEIHSMNMDGGVMRMRRLDGVDLPSSGTAVLAPGGLHMMLFGLKAPLRAGESFPLELRFEKAGKILVQVNVEANSDATNAKHKH